MGFDYQHVIGTDFYLGESIFGYRDNDQIKQSLNNKFDDTIFPCLIRSALGYLPETKMSLFSVREHSDAPYIKNTYHFLYAKNMRDVLRSVRDKKAIYTDLCYPPHGVYAIEVAGRHSKKQLLDIVRGKYLEWLHDQKKYWNGNEHLIIAVFITGQNEWFIAENLEHSRKDFGMNLIIVPSHEWNFEAKRIERIGLGGEVNGD